MKKLQAENKSLKDDVIMYKEKMEKIIEENDQAMDKAKKDYTKLKAKLAASTKQVKNMQAQVKLPQSVKEQSIEADSVQGAAKEPSSEMSHGSSMSSLSSFYLIFTATL